MMVPTKSLVLASAALALFGATAGAQQKSNKTYRRANASGQWTFDTATGTYTRGPVVNNRGGTTITDLSNNDIFDGSGFGWATVDTGGGSCTWFSNAAKGLGVNQGGQPVAGSDLMSDILFFYCSGALDPRSGGPGGTVELGFYEGYTVFGGAPSTTATVFTLSGMPGATLTGGIQGAARCYQATVEFSPMVAFADNVFVGYSWHYLDVGTDGTWAATFPFLSCIVSCSGTSIFSGNAGGAGGATGLGEDGQGMLDVFDAFCTGAFPNGPTAHSWTYATGGAGAPPWAPTTRASMGMEVHEATERASTNNNYNDVAPVQNLDTLTATPATIGTTWTATFLRAQLNNGRFNIGVWRDRSLFANGIAPGAIIPPWPAGTAGRCMTSGSFLAFVPPIGTTTYTTGVGVTVSNIPLDFVFCGLHFACQARSGSGAAGTNNPRLSSAVEGTIGTF
jgi:hypothetical protein